MELFEKSLSTLELPAVLTMLAAEAVSEPAKTRALELRPSCSEYEIKKRQAETSAACAMMTVKGTPSFSGVRDVRGALARADMGGALNPRELLEVAGVLQSARLLRAYGTGASCGRTELDFLFQSLRANRFLEDKIFGSIVSEDEIADAASSELADLRRKIRAAGARAREALQRILSSTSLAKALQEPIITTRSERFVVPVKAEYRSAVPGLVHDVSASGATLFVEPMAAVKANNEIRELRAKERREIERILAELSAACAASRDDLDADFTVLVTLDLIFAKAKLSVRLDCCEPVISEKGVVLRQARHPLLPRETAVPIDLHLGDDYDTLVITGPNTGGKTVSLKTLGLLSLMAQCGLHIPARDGSALPVFQKVLADIGDEQSIEQNLSTFSAHMTNTVRILEECGEGTLLLFDELGAGTDPVEGAALAMAIIEYARQKHAVIAATTHYSELKIYATNTQGVMNASCEFDVETLRPTYRLLIGIPGKSNAFAISERLGMPEAVLADARARLSAENTGFEETIERLERTRQSMENDRLEAAKYLRQAQEEAKKAVRLRAELTVRLEKAEERARRDAVDIIAQARREAEQTFAELDALRSRANEAEDARQANEARAELRRRLNEADARLAVHKEEPVEQKTSERALRPGDVVEIKAMGVKATVLTVNPDHTVLLQAGVMKVTAKENELFLLKEKPAAVQAGTTVLPRSEQSASSEIDLRGMMADEAVSVTEQFIYAAVMGRLNCVRIIHGKGTGALRAAVQQSLRRNRQVKSFRLGRFGEGEAGVTIVELK